MRMRQSTFTKECLRSMQYCLSPEARVLTEDLEWVEVGGVCRGDRLVGFDEEGPRRKYRSAVVNSTGRIILPCYRVTFTDGTSVVASDGHKWLSPNSSGRCRWVTTEYLYKWQGRWNAPRISRPLDVWDSSQTFEAGYLAGMFDGEGSLSRTYGGFILQAAQNQNEALVAMESALVLEGFNAKRYDQADCRRLVVLGGRPEILRFLGQVRPPRLLAKWRSLGASDSLGSMHTNLTVAVASVEPLGDREVVAIGTTTKTLMVEGLASHNSLEDPVYRSGIVRAVGTAYHAGLELFYSSRMTGYATTANPIHQAAQDSLTAEIERSGDEFIWDPEKFVDEDAARATIGVMLDVYFIDEHAWPQDWEILGVEMMINLPWLNGHTKGGQIDLVLRDPNGWIVGVDHKTAAKAWPKDKAHPRKNHQGCWYGGALRELYPDAPGVRYMFDVMTYKGKFQRLPCDFNAGHVKAADDKALAVLSLYEGMRANGLELPVNPGSNLCSARYCDFFSTCPSGAALSETVTY